MDPTVAEDDVGRAFAGDDVRVGDDDARRDDEAGPVLLAPAGDALDLHRRGDHAADGRKAEPGVQRRGAGVGRSLEAAEDVGEVVVAYEAPECSQRVGRLGEKVADRLRHA